MNIKQVHSPTFQKYPTVQSSEEAFSTYERYTPIIKITCSFISSILDGQHTELYFW